MYTPTELPEFSQCLRDEIQSVWRDEKDYYKQKYNLKMYNNQMEIVDTIINPLNHYIAVVQARGGGKTFSVALAIIEVCQNVPDMKVGIFAPKLGQSKKMVKQIYDIVKVSCNSVKNAIDTANSSSETIRFFNGSIIETSSANERTMSEGAHYNIIVIDEAHLVSDYSMSSKILPMLGSYKYRQLIKIGVAMFKNHFHSAFNNTKYTVIKRDWLECDILKEAGIMTYTNDKGETKDYPIAVIDNMPNEAKKKYFPDRPDLITGKTDLSYLDFMMQYELEWLDDISLLLNEAHQNKLVGIHDLTATPMTGAIYVFGLDTAGGSVDPETLSLDYTSLSIWEIRGEQLLKVYAEQWQGSPMLQYVEIKERLKRFKTRYGLIDFSNIGIGFVEQFQKDQIRCEGIMYAKSAPESKKDYKTTMFENFLNKLEIDQIKYPKAIEKQQYDQLVMNNPNLATAYMTNDEHFYQWCILERIKSKRSDKLRIEAPRGNHDDGCLKADTVIPLTDGTKHTMKELSEMNLDNQYTYSVDLSTMLIKQGKIKRCWKTGNKKIIKIVLDSGECLECTEDHPIMMRDGSYKDTKDLKENDSLMPLSIEHIEVKAIIDEGKFADVYDMEIENYHNFAIESGIFVHNCNSDVLACYAVNKTIGKLDNTTAFNFLSSKSTFFS